MKEANRVVATPSKATPTTPIEASGYLAAPKRYLDPRLPPVYGPKPLPKPRKVADEVAKVGTKQGYALWAPNRTEVVRALRGVTHGEIEVPCERHYEITGEHATHVNIVWRTTRAIYVDGAHTEIRWERVTVPGAFKVAPDYRVLPAPKAEPTIEPVKGPIVAFREPRSAGEAKWLRKQQARLNAKAYPLVPCVATHGERPVQAEIAMHVALANNMAANGVPMPVAKLGSWGIGSPTIVGKRLVRESDGGGERARGITAAQWSDALSARSQPTAKGKADDAKAALRADGYTVGGWKKIAK